MSHQVHEYVEHDDPVAALPDLPDDVASDVAGAAGDEHVPGHCGSLLRQ